MGLKVCKFGGTSVANAVQLRKVQAIVQSDPDRRLVVISAPGKRDDHDQKITDLLYLCHKHAQQEIPFDDVFERIEQRFDQIVRELGLSLDLQPQLAQIKQNIASGQTADYAASRGEYLNAQILAALLGYHFVDAAQLMFFDVTGQVDSQRTYAAIRDRLTEAGHAVVPGFYGTDSEGQIKTFTRGGSDVSGALVAASLQTKVYENWTDVPGLLMADPRIIENPRKIDRLTYRELRELAYMGATVLHDAAIFPVRDAGVPVNIRNTNQPNESGTLIVSELEPVSRTGTITGVAGQTEFTVIALEKALMNTQIGFGRCVLSVLERYGISFEHLPSGIDTMSIVIEDRQLDGKLDDVLESLRKEVEPDAIEVFPSMALIATVGRGMTHTPGMASTLFGALATAGINVRMIDQGSSELNIIVGVEADDFQNAVRAIYHAFVE